MWGKSGKASNIVEFGGTGGCGAPGSVRVIDPSLEEDTRKIMAAMGGEQPTELEWQYLFMRSSGLGSGGAISSEMAEKINTAYRLAAAGFRQST